MLLTRLFITTFKAFATTKERADWIVNIVALVNGVIFTSIDVAGFLIGQIYFIVIRWPLHSCAHGWLFFWFRTNFKWYLFDWDQLGFTTAIVLADVCQLRIVGLRCAAFVYLRWNIACITRSTFNIDFWFLLGTALILQILLLCRHYVYHNFFLILVIFLY